MSKEQEIQVELDSNEHHIATITRAHARSQTPTWKSLRRYWRYAKRSEVEYLAVSRSGVFVVFCLTVASGQGGIVATWNTVARRWQQVYEASYVACAMLVESLNAIVSLHYISCWGVPGHHSIYVAPFDRTKDGFAAISSQIGIERKTRRFAEANYNIIQRAYGNYVEGNHGPIGLFLLDDHQTFLGHDCGNLYKFTTTHVHDALTKRHKEADQDRGVKPLPRTAHD
jgi:hypothetical protein